MPNEIDPGTVPPGFLSDRVGDCVARRGPLARVGATVELDAASGDHGSTSRFATRRRIWILAMTRSAFRITTELSRANRSSSTYASVSLRG